MELIVFQLGIPLALIILGFASGSVVERKHYQSIQQREQETLALALLTQKRLPPGYDAESSRLVTGSAVISIDYFKRFVASLKKVIGGHLGTYETLLDRARREALLRMKADAKGADLIVCVRIETSTVDGNVQERDSVGSVEALAYGTAIKLKK